MGGINNKIHLDRRAREHRNSKIYEHDLRRS